MEIEKMDIFGKAWEYEMDLEDAFVNLYHDLHYVDCNKTDQKQLDKILDQIDTNIYKLKSILWDIEQHSK